MSKKTSLILLAFAAVFMVSIGVLLNPIPQPLSYHQFADRRSWFGIPNTLDVLSNIPFALAGVWGLIVLFSSNKVKFIDNREKYFWIGISLGLILTAIGSSYYHLDPNNFRLVADRLPMTIVFMSLVAALISERYSVSLGLCLWPILLSSGIYSVLHWHISEVRGVGDLRFYIGVQEFTVLLTLIMVLTPSPYNRNRDLGIVVALYILARVFELFDHQIYSATHEVISGHTLKHLSAAAAGGWLIFMISERKIVGEEDLK